MSQPSAFIRVLHCDLPEPTSANLASAETLGDSLLTLCGECSTALDVMAVREILQTSWVQRRGDSKHPLTYGPGGVPWLDYHSQLLSRLCEFTDELSLQGRMREAAEVLEGAIRWFAPPDGIDEEIQLARTWLQLGVVQAQLGRYEDALRSFSLLHTKYWGEKEDQELLNVSAKAWLEKCLVLLQMGKITESADALLGTVGTVSGPHWGGEELAYAICVLERIPAICRNKEEGEVDAFLKMLSDGIAEVENLALRGELARTVEKCGNPP